MCFCGDSLNFGIYGESKACTIPCVGNPSQICGNSLVNSVYETSLGKKNKNEFIPK